MSLFILLTQLYVFIGSVNICSVSTVIVRLICYPGPALAIWYYRCLRLCVCVCVCVRVSVCVNYLLVRAITRDAFKLGSPIWINYSKDLGWGPYCVVLFCFCFFVVFFFFFFFLGGGGQLTMTSKVKFNLKVRIYPYFEIVRTITHHPFKLGSPNLNQRCKIARLRSLLFGWQLTLTFKVKFDLKSRIFWSHHHWKYITTIWPPESHEYIDCCTGLFRGLHPLRILIYLDCLTVPTVSQSQHVACILI